MRVAQIERNGGPEAIVSASRPTPEPRAGEVRVCVEAAGVNFVDVYTRTGLYPSPLPAVLGREGAGVVEALGEGAAELRVGDRVAWAGVSGSYASHVVAPASALVKVPDAVPLPTAAAVMLQGMTVDYLVRAVRPLGRGDRCLIHAGAGGVGLLFCQRARALGVEVFATVSSEEKAKLAREAGATHVIDYRRTDFAEEVKRLTEGQLLDVVYDSVGKDTFEQSLRCLRPRGMLVLFGQSSGPVPPFELRVLSDLGSLFVTRPTLRDYTRTREELVDRATTVLQAVARGELDVRIHSVLPLERAAEAHRLLEGRGTSGKLVLAP
ncbi:MAG TPA: quinone oxidoreductase [Polyangiaceae bacterium]|jgi:NADPH2:quinone reductase